MNAARVSRKGHKWLALVVGVQLVAWSLSGLYMVVMDLDFIHGDPLVRNLEPAFRANDQVVETKSLRSRFEDIRSIALRAAPDLGKPVYEIEARDGVFLVDAATGELLSPLPAARIGDLARAYYAGNGAVARVSLIDTEAAKPTELQSRPLPLWRVDFDDWLDTTLYLHPDTGRLVTRRHRFWRWFDFLWSLHIMDYRDRSDVNNWLLRIATAGGVLATGSGIWLLYFSFGFLQRRRRQPSRGRRGASGHAGAAQ
jgi:uncharacterized iron-regulated membrane protein